MRCDGTTLGRIYFDFFESIIALFVSNHLGALAGGQDDGHSPWLHVWWLEKCTSRKRRCTLYSTNRHRIHWHCSKHLCFQHPPDPKFSTDKWNTWTHMRSECNSTLLCTYSQNMPPKGGTLTHPSVKGGENRSVPVAKKGWSKRKGGSPKNTIENRFCAKKHHSTQACLFTGCSWTNVK